MIDLILVLAGLPALAASAYLAALAALSRRSPAPNQITPKTRFDVVVPAHNEEADIVDTVASLRAVAYPTELFRVVVVADNCTDATAARAAAAGADVWPRVDPDRLGKGHALAFAAQRSLSEGFADAVAI